MQIISIIPKTFSSNTYILKSKASAFVVDPSVAVDTIENTLAENGLTIKGILLTHGHFDHTTSIDTLRKRFGVPVYIHSADACMLTDGHLNGFYTFFNRDCIHNPADLLFTDGEKIQLSDEYITVMHTPGHSKGSSCFIFNDDILGESIITGDTLFANSIGRCDLYGGNIQEMKNSVEKLSSFPESTPIYPGHDASSTIGAAIRNVKYIFDF